MHAPILRIPMLCVGLNVEGSHVIVTLKPPGELGVMTGDLQIRRQEIDCRFRIGETYTLTIECPRLA